MTGTDKTNATYLLARILISTTFMKHSRVSVKGTDEKGTHMPAMLSASNPSKQVKNTMASSNALCFYCPCQANAIFAVTWTKCILSYVQAPDEVSKKYSRLKLCGFLHASYLVVAIVNIGNCQTWTKQVWQAGTYTHTYTRTHIYTCTYFS